MECENFLVRPPNVSRQKTSFCPSLIYKYTHTRRTHIERGRKEKELDKMQPFPSPFFHPNPFFRRCLHFRGCGFPLEKKNFGFESQTGERILGSGGSSGFLGRALLHSSSLGACRVVGGSPPPPPPPEFTSALPPPTEERKGFLLLRRPPM